jgi:hypothetical protein
MNGTFDSNLHDLHDTDWQRFTELISKAKINYEMSEWDLEKVQNLINSLFRAFTRKDIDYYELQELFIFVLQISLETLSLRFYLAGALHRLSSYSIPEENRNLSWIELVTGNKTPSVLEEIASDQRSETHIPISQDLKGIVENLTAIVKINVEDLSTLSVTTLVKLVKDVIQGFVSLELDNDALHYLQTVTLALGESKDISPLLATQLNSLNDYIRGFVLCNSAIDQRRRVEQNSENIG